MRNAKLLGHICVLLNKGGKFDEMLEVIEFLNDNVESCLGVVEEQNVEEMFAACYKIGHTKGALVYLSSIVISDKNKFCCYLFNRLFNILLFLDGPAICL